MQTPMKHSFRKNQKLILVAFCSLLLVIVLMSNHGTSDGDDSFWENFLSYFHRSQPEQVITKDVYQKPSAGTSVAVPVIVYHSVRPTYPGETFDVKRYTTEPETLDKELAFLRDNNYHVISLDALSKYFDDGIPLPAKSIVLTFDDGWQSQYTYAFPLLKKYGLSATFFIFTNAIGHKNFMTWDQVKEMNLAGMDIGGHTKTHPYLTKITDPEILEKEITGGKQIIEEHIGHTIDTFAYPFGLYNASTTQAALSAGYRIARTSRPGIWHTEKSLLELTALYDQDSSALFSKFISTTEQVAKLIDKHPAI